MSMNQDTVTPSRGYLICCIERTGSNLLIEALLPTGVAGWPREYFNPASQDKPLMRDILGESTMVTGLRKIVRAATTPNRVFGAKLHWSHVRYFAEALNTSGDGLPHLEPGLLLKRLTQSPGVVPTAEFLERLRQRAATRAHLTAVYRLFESEVSDLRIIWLRRRNMIGRAISHYRALRSNAWIRPATDRDAVASEPDFDFAQIHKLYGLGLFQEECWQWLFAEVGVTPHGVMYEDLDTSYEETVRGVLRFLGLDEAVRTIVPPRLRRQADALSAEWELRYRELSAAAGL